MITSYISSKCIVERIYDDYNIQSDDFVSRVATWTYNVIRDLKIRQCYILENLELEVLNGKCRLPESVDKVYGIRFQGVLLDTILNNKLASKTFLPESTVYGISGEVYKNESNPIYTIDGMTDELIVPNEMANVFGTRVLPESHCGLDGFVDNIRTTQYQFTISNGWIHIPGLDSGTIEVICGNIPYEYDSDLDMIFPVIPDDEAFRVCLLNYCLTNILMRGYKHPILDLKANNEFVNPALAYKNNRLAAKNSCNALSPSAKMTLGKILGHNIL